MSPVSKRRKPRSTRPARGRPANPTGELAGTVLRALGQTLAEPTPLAAELTVSGMLGYVWASQEFERSEATDALAAMLVAQPRVRTHPAGGVLLRVLSQLAPGAETRAAAAEAYAADTAAWVRPAWIDRVNDVRLVGHRVLGDVYGDQLDHFWEFRYVGLRGAEHHTVVTLTDVNLHLVKDLFAREGRDIALQFPLEDGSQWVEMDLQSSYDDVAEHVRVGEMTIGEPFGDETAQTWLLLNARMRAMKKRARRTAPREWTEQERDEVVSAFLATGVREQMVADASEGDEVTEDVSFIVRTIVDYAIDYGGGDPLRWSPTAAELYLSDWAPRKVLWEMPDVPWVPEVLDRYVGWAGERTGLAERFVEETRDTVDRFGGDFLVACLDPGKRGMATQLLESMLQDSVDLTDQAAVQAWIDRYNRSLP